MFDWIKNLWTAFFGKDTPDFYTQKAFTNPQPIPAAATIVFRDRIGWFAGAIRKMTYKWGNHIGIGMGGTKTIEAEANGIVRDDLKRLGANDQVIIFINKNLTALQGAMITQYAESKLGERYGYDELPNFVLETDYNDNAADFCSELDVNANAQGGQKISNKAPELTAPGDIMTFMLSVEGVAAGWIVFDTYNILVSDIKKLTV